MWAKTLHASVFSAVQPLELLSVPSPYELSSCVIKLHLNTPTVYILPVLHLVCDIVYYLSPLQVVQLQVLWSVMKHAREPIPLLVHSVFIAIATGSGGCSLGWHSYTAALTSLHVVASRTL